MKTFRTNQVPLMQIVTQSAAASTAATPTSLFHRKKAARPAFQLPAPDGLQWYLGHPNIQELLEESRLLLQYHQRMDSQMNGSA